MDDDKTWIILDVRNGGVDGYYAVRRDAENLVEGWCERLGHRDVIVAEIVGKHPMIGPCFLADRMAIERMKGTNDGEFQTH